jgi:hypothetical protein
MHGAKVKKTQGTICGSSFREKIAYYGEGKNGEY